MQNQVKTINVDELWMRGKMDSCSEYILLSKIKRKYTYNIEGSIRSLSKELRGKNFFDKTSYQTKRRILYLVESLEKFNVTELKLLADSDLSLENFLYRVYEIKQQKNKGTTPECRD